MTIQPKQIFTNIKTGKVVRVRWDSAEYIARGYVQFEGFDADGKKVGPILQAKLDKFLKAYRPN